MKYKYITTLFALSFALPCFSQAWSGIISTARATNWTYAGIPGDIPPDIANSWTQSGSTISACGTSGSPVSPSTCGITSALSACGTNHYILLGSGDFYLTANIQVPSNCAVRGGGASLTRIHFSSGATMSCNGGNAGACFGTSDFFAGYCSLATPQWPCPAADYVNAATGTANWTAGYSQGATSITLDNVTGIVTTASANPTPIILDQCDTGYAGNGSNPVCSAAASGDGAVTAVTVNAGGTGYAVNDTGTLGCSLNFGLCYGEGNATYKVLAESGGVVSSVSITAGGSGYTYSSTASTDYVTTTHTSGSGSGLQLSITGIQGYDNNGLFACAITMVCTYLSSANNSRPVRTEQEVVMATAISGTGPYTVTLSHPIIAPDWASGRSPQAYWGPSATVIVNAGIEDVELDQSSIPGPNGASCVTVDYGYKIWVYGVACNVANIFHVTLDNVSNVLVASSYFYGTLNHSTTSYGIGCQAACAVSLFENNIEQQIVDSEVPAGPCAGCVFGYNFAINAYDTSSAVLFATSTQHAGGTNYILTEGDIGNSIYQDNSHGPHFMDTYFRNYMNGYAANNGTLPTQATIPASIGAFSRYNNYLGNVLGTAGYHNVNQATPPIYQCVPASSSQQYCNNTGFAPVSQIWDIGFAGQGQWDFTNTPTHTPNDLLTVTSLYRYGNYDVDNAAVQWNSSEVPTGDPNFPNSVPATHAMPSSFYDGVTGAFPNGGTGLSFWKNPTTGLVPPYPPIGPDVTSGDIGICTTGTYKWSRALTSGQCAGGSFTAGSSTNGGLGNSNPAMRCYLNQMAGVPDGTGSFLSFSRSACYASDPSSSSPTPGTPTLLISPL
jgi:hypothetical protein